MMANEELNPALVSRHLPLAWVDLDAFDKNIEIVEKFAKRAGKTLRVATKSIRVPQLIKRILNRGGVFKGVMTYCAQESLKLFEEGIDDIFLAYPTLQQSDLDALRSILSQGGNVSMVVDSEDQLEMIEQVFDEKLPLPVVIEYDASLRIFGLHIGVKRSRIRSVSQFAQFFDRIQNSPSLRLEGVMLYDGQLAGLEDRNPFKGVMNLAFMLIRKLSLSLVKKRQKLIGDFFSSRDFKPRIFNTGGSGSLNLVGENPSVTELTAGSAFMCPHLFDYYSNISFNPACFFALQAVRQSDPGFITCQGGGYIASGAPSWDRSPVPTNKKYSVFKLRGFGEVQTPFHVKGKPPALGTALVFRHAKGGELAERFDSYYLIHNNQIVDKVPTYRGMGWSFF